MVFFAAFWLYHGSIALDNVRQGKKVWIKENSLFYKDGNGQFDYKCLIGLTLRAIGSVFAMATVYFISNASYEADLSPSIAMSFTSSTMFLVALLFYFLYGETLTKRVFIGMFLVLVSILMVSVSKASQTALPGKEDVGLLTKILPILLALFLSCLNTSNNFFVRYLGLRGYSAIRIAVDYLYIYSFFSMSGFLYETFYGTPYTWPQIYPMLFASACLLIGHSLGNYALKNGNGGMMSAIIQLQSLF